MEEKELEPLCRHVPGLGKRLEQFYESFFGEDYDGILLLTYPRIYNLMPKAAMREKIYEAFHNPDTDVNRDLVTIDRVGKLVDHEEGRFVKIDYTLLMAVRFKADLKENSKKKRAKQKKEFLLAAFEEKYGKENIWFEETTMSYCFHVKNAMVAIEDEDSPQWTFLTIKKGPMMEIFLPDEVRIIFEADM
jgi:hypothetical protein